MITSQYLFCIYPKLLIFFSVDVTIWNIPRWNTIANNANYDTSKHI